MATYSKQSVRRQQKAIADTHQSALDYILANLSGSKKANAGQITYNGKFYTVLSHRVARENMMVVDYLKLPDYRNVIYFNPLAQEKKLYLIEAKELKSAVDKELGGRGHNVWMSNMTKDILDNAGLCVTIKLDWLSNLGFVQTL